MNDDRLRQKDNNKNMLQGLYRQFTEVLDIPIKPGYIFLMQLPQEHIMLKMAKLEFENHKNQYFSWLLRSEQVKTNIFGNRMTKFV